MKNSVHPLFFDFLKDERVNRLTGIQYLIKESSTCDLISIIGFITCIFFKNTQVNWSIYNLKSLVLCTKASISADVTQTFCRAGVKILGVYSKVSCW